MVRLATQVLIRSVTKSLLVWQNLKMPEFSDAHSISDILMCFDNLFDIMKSKFQGALGLKAPISCNNYASISIELEKCRRYILGLKPGSGKNVSNGQRKAEFLARINDIKYVYYYSQGPLKYILMYKMSQDPIEHFFLFCQTLFGMFWLL